MSTVGLQEQGFVDDTVKVVGDTSGTVGGSGASKFLLTTVCAGCAGLQSFLTSSSGLLASLASLISVRVHCWTRKGGIYTVETGDELGSVECDKK